MRVLAAMSGGVDSAVAAARAVDAGHDVVGVHLALSRSPATLRTGARGCCTVEDAHDARRAADVLGIPFYVWDLAEQFQAAVVDDFVREYAAGRTPNPCVRCNERIKFSALLDKAIALGFDAVCTGHYARVLPGADGRPELHRSVDVRKDQSYVLGVLTPERLDRALFPLGDSCKDDVRAEAAARGLAVADKPDSHDICFIADGDTQAWLADRLGAQPGEIRGEDGELLGSHEGAYAFTVGQRKGLRIGRPAPDGRPRYVLDVQPVSRTVVVGPAESLDVDGLEAEDARWCAPAPVGDVAVRVQVRAHGETVPARATVSGSIVRLTLEEPLRGVAPGQAAVLYDGTRVLGSATIAATGLGSWPGTDVAEALRVVRGELPDLPHLPELPERGPGADMVGRAAARLVGMPVDLQPAGWRLVDRPGHDQARADAFWREDLDRLAHAFDEYEGPLKVQLAGPWTLAASVWLPRGERAVVDPGAARDLVESSAEAVAGLVRDVTRLVPGAQVVVQLDEPSLPAVLEGGLPTASGLGRLRSVEGSVAEQGLATVLAAAADSGATTVVHCCAPRPPVGLLARTGAAALSLDTSLLGPQAWESIAAAVEDGVRLWAGVLPTSGAPRSAADASAVLARSWQDLGLPLSGLADVVVTPACGLAGCTPAQARTLLARAVETGRALAERSAG